MENNRSYGVDVLKILAMVLICGHHVLTHGGVLDAAAPGGAAYALAWLMYGITSVGVNVFAMTSGYLGAGRRFRLSSAVMHWLQVAFYTVSITLIALVLWPGTVGKQELLNAVCPVSYQQYWYVTAYFCMLFFTPVLNQAIMSLSKSSLAACTAGVLLLLSVQQTGLQFDIYGANNGYSALWLMVMYLVGGLWKRVEADAPGHAGIAGGAAACACFAGMWVFKLLVEAMGMQASVKETLLMRYTSPLMVIAALGLMIACTRLPAPNALAARRGAAMAQASFGVYLIHEHLMIREHVVSGGFAWIAQYGPAGTVLLTIACAAGVFVCCAAIDRARAALFRIFRVRMTVQRVLEGAARLACRRY